MVIKIKIPKRLATTNVLNFCNDFKGRAIEESDLPAIKVILNKIWKDLIDRNFRKRKLLGLKTTGRLRNALIITIPGNNMFHWNTKLLYRNKSDGEGGPCKDYSAILFTGYSAGKPTMGKWLSRTRTGRLVDAQLFDDEGHPIGTHGAMPPYLKAVAETFEELSSKALAEYVTKKFNKQLKQVIK